MTCPTCGSFDRADEALPLASPDQSYFLQIPRANRDPWDLCPDNFHDRGGRVNRAQAKARGLNVARGILVAFALVLIFGGAAALGWWLFR